MSETKVNNNQLNLGDLSGALIEQANIITAGKKQIATALINSGITNVAYTDSLSKMADAITNLNANGLSIDPKIPLLLMPSNVTSNGAFSTDGYNPTTRVWKKLPGKPNIIWRNYNSGIKLIDCTNKTFSGNEPVDLDITVSAIRTALNYSSSQMTYSTFPRFWYDEATESFYLWSNDFKLVKVAITFNDNLVNSTWTATELLSSFSGSGLSAGYSIDCFNSTANKAILRSGSSCYIMDCSTGNYTSFTWPFGNDFSSVPFIYGYDYNGVSALIKKANDTYNPTPLTVAFIDWSDPSQSEYIITSDNFETNEGFTVDYENAKVLCSNLGEVDLINKTYTQGVSNVKKNVGTGAGSGSGGRNRTFARITASNGDIIQFHSNGIMQVFASDKTQRLLPGNYSGAVAQYTSTYYMNVLGGYGGVGLFGHTFEVGNKICFGSCSDSIANIYEVIVDYDRFIAWPVIKNGSVMWLSPTIACSWNDFMGESSPFLRNSITVNVNV